MKFKSKLIQVVLLLLGCTPFIFMGFADEKERSIGEQKMVEEDKLPDADTVENIIEDLSVGYFDHVANEQDKIFASGVYYYYYHVLPFEKESMEKWVNR